MCAKTGIKSKVNKFKVDKDKDELTMMCRNIRCPCPFSVVVSPRQAQVLELEGREAGGGSGKKKHLDVSVLDYAGSSLSLLYNSSCSEPRSPETKMPKVSQVAFSPGSKEEKEIGKRNEEVESEPEKNKEVFYYDALDFEPEEAEEDVVHTAT